MLKITAYFKYHKESGNSFIIKKLICILIVFMGMYNYSLAYNFKVIGKREGLSQLSVMGIHQDRMGRMWFGTEEGLNLFDGNRIKIFHSGNISSGTDSTSSCILGNSNYPIVEDIKGNLYFRSDNSLIKYDLGSQKFSRIAHKGFFTLASHDGKIWLGYKDAIYRLEDDTLRTVYRLRQPDDIKALHVQDHMLWIGSEKCLYRVDLQKWAEKPLLKASVWSIYQDSKKDLWIATRKDGVFRITGNEHLEHIDISDNDDKTNTPNEIRCFVEDSIGNMWIGTFNGLIKYDLSSHRISHYTTRDGMSHNSVFSLFRDRDNNIWVGTYYGGVNYFNAKEYSFRYYSGKELITPFVGNMTEDNDSNLWICTEGGGLTCYHHDTHEFTHQPVQWTIQGNTTVHPNLKAISFDKTTNYLYIGTTTGGLSRYSIKEKTFKHYNLDEKIYRTLGSSVDKICQYQNYLLLQVRGGIYKMDKATEEITPLIPGKSFHNFWTRTFTVDSKGNIWIAGYSNLQRINFCHPEDHHYYPYDTRGLGRYPVTCIAESPAGDILVGTRGSGIFRYNRELESFEALDDKLNNIFCYDIKFSKTGKMIILTDNGIFFRDPSNCTMKAITLQDCLEPLRAINIGCKAYVASDSLIYAGGVNGLVSFREDLFNQTDVSHKIYISTLKINGQDIFPSGRKLVLTAKENRIAVEIGTTNFLYSNKKNCYLYKMEGYDHEWKRTLTDAIEYRQLPAGNYKLIIKEDIPNYSSTAQTCLNFSTVHYTKRLTIGIVVLIIIFLLLIKYGIGQRVKRQHASIDRDSSMEEHVVKEENICHILEELQKAFNQEGSQRVTFIYTNRTEGDLFYYVNKQLYKELLTCLIHYTLNYVKDDKSNIEIVASTENNRLITHIIDYSNKILPEAELNRINAICSNTQPYLYASDTDREEHSPDIHELYDLIRENHASISVKNSNGYGIILALTIDNSSLLQPEEDQTESTAIQQGMTGTSSQESPDIDNDFIKQIDNIILQNISNEHFNISDIFTSLCMSRTSFYLKFKDETGLSPNEYLVNFRLSYAKDLLSSRHDLQVADIAYQSGFNSPRYFSRCFKQRYKISPVLYRKKHSEDDQATDL